MAGSTVPIPKKPKNVAQISNQKRAEKPVSSDNPIFDNLL
jgi:hypothetical protein